MRFVTFNSAGQAKSGLMSGDGVLDLAAAHFITRGCNDSRLASMQSIIESGDSALDLCRELCEERPERAWLALDKIELLSPLPVPAQMRDFLSFETHMRQAGESVQRLQAKASADPEAALKAVEANLPVKIPPVWYQQPIYYKCNRFSVAGSGHTVRWPKYSKVMDYELEMAAVIGKTGKDISVPQARSHIFGYTIFNDFTARDAQALEMSGPLGPAKGKDFDGASILGPCIVTPDELPDPYNLRMIARINGEEWTNESSSSIHWTFEQMIAFVSRDETLYPGEVICSGTVGNGCGLERMRFLKSGDVVELEIEKIGRLVNRIEAQV